MKKVKAEPADELRPEYHRSDFGKLVSGKYADRIKEESNVVLLEPDIAQAFPMARALGLGLIDDRNATGGIPMTELEQVSDLYRRLPPDARREALDFMLFLKQRYDDRVPARPAADPSTILERVGFIGSLDAEPNLSENYKAALTKALEHKHGDR